MGFDISEELDEFKQKFKLAKELKDKFIFQENLMKEMKEKGNSYKKTSDFYRFVWFFL